MLLKQPPSSSFKELIILTLRLVLSLHTMSLAKTVPEGIRDKECKRFALQERPPVPYMPEKDSIQEMVSALKSDQSLKTTIGEDAELRLPILHCGTRDAFLMHVSTALDGIKKRGTFKAYKKAQEAYVEQWEVAKQAKATLALLMAPTSKGEKDSEKALAKNPLRRKRLPSRPRKVRLWPKHQPQNFAKSTRPSTTRPSLQKRPPRTCMRLLPRDVSVLCKLAVFGCQVLVEQNSPGADKG
jgi:hypothetical protein